MTCVGGSSDGEMFAQRLSTWILDWKVPEIKVNGDF